MRFTATRNASSAVSPASIRVPTCSRRWSSSSATSAGWTACRRRRYALHWAICSSRDAGSAEGDIAQAPCRRGRIGVARPAGSGTGRSFHRLRSVSSTACHCLSSSASWVTAAGGDAVVLATAAVLPDFPAGLDVVEPFEAVQHGVEHAVRPLQVPAGRFADALEDGVPVTVTLGQDREDDGGRGGGGQVFTDLRHLPSPGRRDMSMQYIAALCIATLCIVKADAPTAMQRTTLAARPRARPLRGTSSAPCCVSLRR